MKYHIISLGCPKNLVDSERFSYLLEKAKYEFTPAMEVADLILINTCGFILDAKEEAIQTILEAIDVKKNNCKLIVTGCFVKRYFDDLKKEIPEIDHLVNLKDFVTFAHLLSVETDLKRKILTPAHFAYLRISDGCNNHCSYCAIPAIRGKLQSELPDDLLTEAEYLAKQGVKELIISAQDTTQYGKDLSDKPSLLSLLQKLSNFRQFQWIRLLYLHPAHVTKSMILELKKIPKLCPYFEIPFQHINDEMLKKMNRHTTKEHCIELIKTIRQEFPEAIIRTTFIVGFPGESEEAYQELKEFIQEARFERMGVFTYSREEGTAAAEMENQIPEEIAEARKDELMQIQQRISTEMLEKMVGKIVPVMIEEKSEMEDFCWVGRSIYDAPEIDGNVFMIDGDVQIGEIVNAEIIDSWEYDLVGKIE